MGKKRGVSLRTPLVIREKNDRQFSNETNTADRKQAQESQLPLFYITVKGHYPRPQTIMASGRLVIYLSV